jgi:hypothetical protein
VIRQDVKESLDRYVQYGIMPGGFLTAVLENDLFEAVGRADAYNLATLADICRYVYNDMPSSCWGSPEKVDRYVRALVEHLEGEL